MKFEFNWSEFLEADLKECNLEKGTFEDDIFGFIPLTVTGEDFKQDFLIDIHYEYYNSKECGFDLEVYFADENGQHGNWLGSVKTIKSAKSYKRFCHRAENAVIEFLTDSAFIPTKSSMSFIDAKILLITAADNGIIEYACPKKQHVLLYRSKSGDSPEGWYITGVEQAASELMYSRNGQKLLVKELTKKGVKIEWFNWEDFHRTMDALLSLAGEEIERREESISWKRN